MPKFIRKKKEQKPQDTTQYKDEENVVFKSDPEEVNVDEEAKTMNDSIGFKPYKLTDALIKIGEKMYGVNLYSYQKEPAFRIIYSLMIGDGAEVTMLFSRQAGKSEIVSFCVVIVGIFFPVLAKYFPEMSHFEDGVKMGIIAPTQDQVETVYSRCMTRILSEQVIRFMADPDIKDAPLSKAFFKLKSGSFLKAQSGAKQSRIESKTYHIVFIDESQDMDAEKVRKSIMPMLAATFGSLVRLGTPNRNRGDFYQKIKQNKRKDRSIRIKRQRKIKQLHFHYDYKEVIKAKEAQYKIDEKRFHTLYAKAVERDRETMGENSDEFRMAYKLEWLLDVGMFVTEERLESLYKKFDYREQRDDDFHVAGLDIASARNSTVLTIGRISEPVFDFGFRPNKTIVNWTELSNLDYNSQLEIIIDVIVKYRIKILYGDYTGVGRPLMDSLIHYLSEYIDIVPYTFSVPSKSEMWKTLDEDISEGKIIIPASSRIKNTQEFINFEEQMLHLEKYWKDKYMICQRITGYKDDYCDSLGLMNLAGNHLYEEKQEIEVHENFLINPVLSDIKKSAW